MLLFLLLTIFADSSWVRIQTMPTEVILVLNEDLANPIAITSGDSLKLPVGKHALRFTHPAFSDIHRVIEPVAGETLSLSIDLRRNPIPIPNSKSTWFVLRNQANLIVKTDNDTRIFLNGEDIGQGTARRMLPYEQLDLTLELRRGTMSQTIPIDFQTHRSLYLTHYLAPERFTYWFLSPIPGMSQLYEGRWKTSLSIIGATAITARVLTKWTATTIERRESYKDIRREYVAATNFNDVEELGHRMAASYPRYNRASQYQQAATFALGAVFAVHVLDVAIPPKYGFRKVSVGPHPYQMIGAEIHLGF